MDLIGITNYGDPALNDTWVKGLQAVKGAIIISKGVGEKFEKNLLDNQDKIIYHATCTGLGGTPLEPKVPTVKEKFEHLDRLIRQGFPVSHIVVRIDPIMPYYLVDSIDRSFGMNYVASLRNILRMTEELGVQRVRYSYLDEFDFVKRDFKDFFLGAYDPRKNYIQDYRLDLRRLNSNLHYESCAEPLSPEDDKFGCISVIDLDILGLSRKVDLVYPDLNMFPTPCRCPKNRNELMLHEDKFKCEFGCVYCYWRAYEYKRPFK